MGAKYHGTTRKPGTGKTLIAKQLQVKQSAIYFNEWFRIVELFAGLGASRVENYLKEQRKLRHVYIHR